MPVKAGTGEIGDITTEAKRMLREEMRLQSIMTEHTGHSVEQIAQDMEQSRYWKAEEAVEYGIVDNVLKNPKNILMA